MKEKQNESQFVRVLTFKHTQQYQAGRRTEGTVVPVASTSKCMQSFWNNGLFSTQVPLLMPAYLTQIHTCHSWSQGVSLCTVSGSKITHTNILCPLYVMVLRGKLPSPGDVIPLCLSTNPPPLLPLVCVCSSWAVLLPVCSYVPAATLRSCSDTFCNCHKTKQVPQLTSRVPLHT